MMDADRFRECLDALCWSQRGLSALLDVHPTTVQRWGNGALNIPPQIATWLDTLAHCHETNPPPIDPARLRDG
jgi:DNA-binding transcriptional regulator YdaS (Cro superfamily)